MGTDSIIGMFLKNIATMLYYTSWQRKEAEGTPQKQLSTPTTPMT